MPTSRIKEVELSEDENINDVLPDNVEPESAELVRRPNEDGERVTYARFKTLSYK